MIYKNIKYPAIFHKDEDGNISGYCFDFMGCIGADIDLKSTINDLKSALNLHIKGMLEDNVKLPKPSNIENIPLDLIEGGFVLMIDILIPSNDDKKRININISKSILEYIDTYAKENNISRSMFFETISKKELGVS